MCSQRRASWAVCSVCNDSLANKPVSPVFPVHPYQVSWRWLRWCCRFRCRQGYGIHSPFAFSFVTGVVYESGTYYAYPSVDRACSAARRGGQTSMRLKDGRLLFRLANFGRPHRAMTYGIGEDSAEMECMRAGSCHTDYVGFSASGGEEADWVFAAADWPEQGTRLLAPLRRGGMLVLRDIGSAAVRRAAWRELLRMPQAQVSFDLYDWGIIFFRPELQRQHYVINYL